MTMAVGGGWVVSKLMWTYYLLAIFYLAISLSWSLPAHSLIFRSPILSRSPPRIEAVPPWKSLHQHRAHNGRYRNKYTPRSNMLPEITEMSIKSPLHISIYFFITNMTYLLRRSHLRKMPKRKLLQIRLTREAGVSLPLYITNIIIWQIFVAFLFPSLELVSRCFGHVSYYYFYPNASGFGQLRV
jgi:hypothetical protein